MEDQGKDKAQINGSVHCISDLIGKCQVTFENNKRKDSSQRIHPDFVIRFLKNNSMKTDKMAR